MYEPGRNQMHFVFYRTWRELWFEQIMIALATTQRSLDAHCKSPEHIRNFNT